jgi:hypothetical protein
MWGKTTGKVGGLVYAISGGEQIVREYNPNVSNPNTDAQVNQRARMKLLSQLSASLAPCIAMTKDGLISKRNKFVKINFENSYALNGIAQVTYENLQLTEGQLGLPQITANVNVVGSSRTLLVQFLEEPSANISRVVYCIFSKSQEGKLSYISSQISTTRVTSAGGTNIYFLAQFLNCPSGDIVIYAYGMVDTSDRATTNYGNLNVVDSSDIARLVATRAISFTDYQFTQTRGATMGADNQPVLPTPEGSIRVFATALGDGGTVTGGGTYEVGASVTLEATPAQGYRFVRWVKNGTNQTLSSSNPYTFTAEEQVDALAVFEVQENESL